MKNLKRVLSLALTGVMLVGMMAIGASAADKDFTDADEIQHTEAVNVMSTLGVLKGKDTGAFDPNTTVTRAEMAKIICVMLNGGNDPTLGTSGANMFSDTASHWAKNYIEYCASMNIIAGQGDGTFAPDAPVTGAAAAKMLLVAMGYDSDIFEFTGVDWEINVNRRANEAKLYEEIKNIDTSAGLSRDNTAQMAYNALEAKIMTTTYDKVASSGEISYNYGLSSQTFLNKYFDAYTWIGTFNGDHNTVSSGVPAGSIQVFGRLDTDIGDDKKSDSPATFPAEFDIANIGEEVKVIFKDGKSGSSGKPDKNDTIYGVFNTGKTTVYNITKNDLQDGDEAKGKIKFGDTEYELDTDGANFTIYTNYVKTKDFDGKAGNEMKVAAKYIEDNLMKQSGDTIKLVANDDGKIYRAYVVATKLGRVTSVTASKITISGIGSIDVDDNDVAEGLKVDDVVAYTRFYNDEDKDKAFFTVVKAEAVEGKITGYKNGDSASEFTNVTIDGTTYKIVEKTLVNTLTDDSMNTLKDEVGTEIKAYLANGMVVAVDKVEGGTSSYALVIGGNGDDTDDKTMSEGRVRLLLSDGTKVTYTVDEDSKLQLKTDKVAAGTLVKYSLDSKNLVDLKEVVTTNNPTAKVWNNDTKKVADKAVAESDAVLYVSTSKDGDYKVYNLRSLKTLTMTDDKDQDVSKPVYYVTNSSGKVTAAYVDYQNTPAGATSDTLYGMVIADNGVVKIDDTYYSQYVVWTGAETEVNIKGQDDPFNTGDYVVFDESNDKTYGTKDVVALATVAGKRTVTDAASKEYSATDKVLGYYTKLNLVNKVYNGDKDNLETAAMDKDAVIIYVNRDGKKIGDEAGIGLFDTSTGYANVKIVADKEGVIVALFVETSGKCDVNGAKTPVTVVEAACEHNLTHHDAKDSTCTVAGNIEYWSCDKCSKNFSDADGKTEVAKVEKELAAHEYDGQTWQGGDSGTHTLSCKNCTSGDLTHEADFADTNTDTVCSGTTDGHACTVKHS